MSATDVSRGVDHLDHNLGAARFDGGACAGQKAWWGRIGCDVGCTVAVLRCCSGSFASLVSVGRPLVGCYGLDPGTYSFKIDCGDCCRNGSTDVRG